MIELTLGSVIFMIRYWAKGSFANWGTTVGELSGDSCVTREDLQWQVTGLYIQSI